MEHSRKRLKEASALVLLFTAFTFVRLLIELFVIGFEGDPAQAGLTEELIMITKIVLAVISFIVLIPQIYIGVKGLKIAKKPASTKGHIIWAVIILCFSVFSVISIIFDIIGNVNLVDSVIALLDHSLDVIVYCMYIKYAHSVLRGV